MAWKKEMTNGDGNSWLREELKSLTERALYILAGQTEVLTLLHVQKIRTESYNTFNRPLCPHEQQGKQILNRNVLLHIS